MQNVSANYQRLRNSQNKWYETRVDIQGVGIVNETDGLFSVDTSLEMFHGSPTIGSAVAGEIEFSLLEQSATIPNMARIQPQVRACGMAAKSSTASVVGERLIPQSASYANENITINTAVSVSGENIIFPVDGEEYAESEWIPQGVFYIDTRETTANQDGLDVLTIHGYDAILKTEQEYASNEAVGDNYDTAYVRAIANAIGVEVDDRTWELMGTGYIVPFPLGYTMREILGFIAASYVGCFIMTDEGKLRLVSLTDLPAETNYLITEDDDAIVFGYDHPETTDTYSGSIVSFENGGNTEIQNVSVAVEPIQDLHGYDNPWPAGGGKNLFNVSSGQSATTRGVTATYDGTNGLIYSGSPTDVGFIGSWVLPTPLTLTAGTYSISIKTPVNFRFCIVSSWANVADILSSQNKKTFTLSETKTIDRLCLVLDDSSIVGTPINVHIEDIQIETGSTATAFAPYSNICPISGWTGATVTRMGKNLLSPQMAQKSSSIVVLGQDDADSFGLSLKAGTYTVSVQSSKAFAFYYRAENGTENVHIGKYNVTSATFTLTEDLRIRLYAYLNAGLSVSDISNPQLELGSTATAYEPYQGETYSITFPTSAGTVYGGTLDVTSGVLTVDRKFITLLPTMSWQYSALTQRFFVVIGDAAARDGGQVTFGGKCNMFKAGKIGENNAVSYVNTTSPGFAITYQAVNGDMAAWKQFLTDNTVNVVYELATPIVYDLTPKQITTLQRANTLWADAGDITVNTKTAGGEATIILV